MPNKRNRAVELPKFSSSFQSFILYQTEALTAHMSHCWEDIILHSVLHQPQNPVKMDESTVELTPSSASSQPDNFPSPQFEDLVLSFTQSDTPSANSSSRALTAVTPALDGKHSSMDLDDVSEYSAMQAGTLHVASTPRPHGSKHGNYPPFLLRQAINQVHAGARPTEVAKELNIPRQTISGRANEEKQGKFRRDHAGQAPKLGEADEKRLADWIVECAEAGFGQTRKMICLEAKRLGEEHKPTPVTFDGPGRLPGRSWWNGFRKRHAIKSLKPKPLPIRRAAQSTGPIVLGFILTLTTLMTTLQIGPENLYNFDETGFGALDLASTLVYCGVAQSAVKVTLNDSFTSHLSVAVAISAIGEFACPLFIMKGKSYRHDLLANAPPGSTLAFSPAGGMSSVILLNWLRRFARTIKRRPLILVLDNHSSRYDVEIIEFCRKEKIHLLALPPNLTHLLQPLDVGVFSAFKHWSEILRLLQARTPDGVTAQNIIQTIAPALLTALEPSTIIEAWRESGLFPPDGTKIPDSDFQLGRRSFRPSCIPDSADPSWEQVRQFLTLESSTAITTVNSATLSQSDKTQTLESLGTMLQTTEGSDSKSASLTPALWRTHCHPKSASAAEKAIAELVANRPVLQVPFFPVPRVKAKSFSGVRILYDQHLGTLLTSDMMKLAIEESRKTKREKKPRGAAGKQTRAEKPEQNALTRDSLASSSTSSSSSSSSSSSTPLPSRASLPRKAKPTSLAETEPDLHDDDEQEGSAWDAAQTAAAQHLIAEAKAFDSQSDLDTDTESEPSEDDEEMTEQKQPKKPAASGRGIKRKKKEDSEDDSSAAEDDDDGTTIVRVAKGEMIAVIAHPNDGLNQLFYLAECLEQLEFKRDEKISDRTFSARYWQPKKGKTDKSDAKQSKPAYERLDEKKSLFCDSIVPTLRSGFELTQGKKIPAAVLKEIEAYFAAERTKASASKPLEKKRKKEEPKKSVKS